VPCVSIAIKLITATATMIPDHKPALNIPAMAEQPATKINKHANINSVKGFILFNFYFFNCYMKGSVIIIDDPEPGSISYNPV
jgi:hypothetical protein